MIVVIFLEDINCPRGCRDAVNTKETFNLRLVRVFYFSIPIMPDV